MGMFQIESCISKVNDWDIIDLSKVKKAEDSKEVENYCIQAARMQRLKSAGLMVLSGVSSFANGLKYAAMAFVAFSVANMAAKIFLLPLILFGPLYGLLSGLGGIAFGFAIFGAYVGYENSVAEGVKNLGLQYFKSSQDHWERANYWYGQAEAVIEQFKKV